MNSKPLIFYYSPQTRASGTRILLEELEAPYEMRVLNMKAGEQRKEPFLSVNPMGKVPTIQYDGEVVTEQAAIFIYLADAFPKKKLAPAIGEVGRGAYLRWMVYYNASFEPAILDRAMKREPARPGMCPYGDYDTMLKTLTDQLAKGPYLLGDRFSAADILWGTALGWTTSFKLVPELPVIMDYIQRIVSRPSAKKVKAEEAVLVAAHEKAAH